MRVDHDQARRDAQSAIENQLARLGFEPHEVLATHIFGLLDEINENDRDNDEIMQAWITRAKKAEDKLATVPALVQILHRYYEAMALERGAGRPLDPDTYTLLLSDAREALAAWEAAQ